MNFERIQTTALILIASLVISALVICDNFVKVSSESYQIYEVTNEVTVVYEETEKEEIIKFNINTATQEELMEISGIGEVVSARIIAMREELGGFTMIEELDEVEGIGESLLESINEYCYVE